MDKPLERAVCNEQQLKYFRTDDFDISYQMKCGARLKGMKRLQRIDCGVPRSPNWEYLKLRPSITTPPDQRVEQQAFNSFLKTNTQNGESYHVIRWVERARFPSGRIWNQKLVGNVWIGVQMNGWTSLVFCLVKTIVGTEF